MIINSSPTEVFANNIITDQANLMWTSSLSTQKNDIYFMHTATGMSYRFSNAFSGLEILAEYTTVNGDNTDVYAIVRATGTSITAGSQWASGKHFDSWLLMRD